MICEIGKNPSKINQNILNEIEKLEYKRNIEIINKSSGPLITGIWIGFIILGLLIGIFGGFVVLKRFA